MLRSGEPAVLLLTGLALREKGLELAARIAGKTGCRLLAQTFNRRMERGAGRISIERIPYPVEQALKTLEGVKHIVLVGSRIPVAFFAYPDKPSLLAPKDTQFTTLSTHRGGLGPRARMARRRARRRAAADRAVEVRPAAARDRQDQLADAGAIARRADPRERHRGRRGRLDRPRLLSRRRAMRIRTPGCRTWAARSASACRWPPARRSRARTARC